MKTRVIKASELSSDLIERWRAIQQADPTLASPYFLPQYTQAVGSVRDDIYVGVIEDGSKVVGFFPFQKENGEAHPVGGRLCDFQGLILEANVALDLPQMLRACGVVMWEFDHVLASQKICEPYFKNVADSPRMDLHDGFEAYAQQRRDAGSKQINKTGTLRRKLEREVGELRYDGQCADKQVLAKVIEWKRQQCQATGSADFFGLDWTVKLVDQLHDTRTEEFGGILSALWVNDQLIAAHMGMYSRTIWHYWFPGYEESYSKFSPGLILLFKMAEEAPSRGLVAIDLGKGDDFYKSRVMSSAIGVADGRVALPSLKTGWRVASERLTEWARHSPIAAPARQLRRYLKPRRSDS